MTILVYVVYYQEEAQFPIVAVQLAIYNGYGIQRNPNVQALFIALLGLCHSS